MLFTKHHTTMSGKTIMRCGTIVLVAALLFNAHTAAAQEFHANRTAGVYVDFEHISTNFSARPYLLVGEYTEPHTSQRTLTQSFIKFDLSGLPHRTSADVAQARLYYRVLAHMGDDHGRLRIFPVARSWNDERAVTWGHAPGLLDTGYDVVSPRITFTPGWHSVDVTSLVKAWLDGHIDLRNGIVLTRYERGWLLTIDDRTYPVYLAVRYREREIPPLRSILGSVMQIAPFGGTAEESSGEADDSGEAAPAEEEASPAEEESSEAHTDSGETSSIALTQIAPRDGATIHDEHPTFRWQLHGAVDGVDKVVLALKNMPGVVFFDTEVARDTEQYTVSEMTLTPGRWYRWYLVGYKDDEEVLRTPEHAFIVEPEEEGLTNERGAAEEAAEDSATGSTITSTQSATSQAPVTSEAAVPATERTVPPADRSATQGAFGPLVAYRWVVVILLLVIVLLLWYILTMQRRAMRRAAKRAQTRQSRQNKRRKTHADESD